MSRIKHVISSSLAFKLPVHFLANQEVKVIPRKYFHQGVQYKVGFTNKSEPAAAYPHLGNPTLKHPRLMWQA